MTIGLTGGIGSGKTTVSKLFETMGCVIYNSDDKAKELYFKPTIKKLITELLGNQAYLNSNEINKKFIADKIFSDSLLLEKLNSIIHPAVKEDFINFKHKFPKSTIIIKESALLFETNLYKELDYTILVTAPIFMKIKRVIGRNNLLKEEIEKRINAQWSDNKKEQLANAIITNDESCALIPQVLSIIQKLKS